MSVILHTIALLGPWWNTPHSCGWELTPVTWLFRIVEGAGTYSQDHCSWHNPPAASIAAQCLLYARCTSFTAQTHRLNSPVLSHRLSQPSPRQLLAYRTRAVMHNLHSFHLPSQYTARTLSADPPPLCDWSVKPPSRAFNLHAPSPEETPEVHVLLGDQNWLIAHDFSPPPWLSMSLASFLCFSVPLFISFFCLCYCFPSSSPCKFYILHVNSFLAVVWPCNVFSSAQAS